MKGPILWKRLFRRSAALFLATLAVWLLLLCGGGAGALQSLGESGAFVSTALAAELGKTGSDTLDKLDGWDRLAVGQSLLLSGNQEAVAQHLDGEEPELQLPAGQPAQDHDDLVEEPQTTTAPSDIIARTLIPTSPEGYDVAGGLYLYNRTGESVDLAAAAQASVNITLPAEGPQILIIHTHTTEAYTPDGTDVYTPDGGVARTLEEEDNMLRVGDEMERVFTEMGLSVIHDRTVHDYPQYNGAYTRSAQTVQKYLEQYPSIKIVLDVHRDALAGEDGTVYKAVTVIDGVDTAQVMLVIGHGQDGSNPHWMENLALACKIQSSMNTLYPTLARPMTFRSSSYNQELSTGSLLVEVGTHGNTLQEALSAARLFARSAGQVLLGLKEQ
ncbi:stage II sporulation protein P [Flavonifractor sp. An9]|uniref:stage II sporulation protein P n=1 Tax=Flavonifractor sp. An9 TaxID=1965664 RepID=UPI000B3814A2|nr:stage II sporulation protein P [Flavonifractor sp. An9]OUN08927.1 stage II sporulation protein P [Flavonifractor sp. An9]